MRVPLVADIHFTPNAALIAAEHVEKVRINPGNYADKKKFEIREYDDASWSEETRARGRALPPAGAALQGARPRAADRHQPRLALRSHHEPLRRHAARHGRIGARVPRRLRGRELPRRRLLDEVEQPEGAVQAYRLLAAIARRTREARQAGDYPFHLGVTEAGDGEDGRIKSAIGIGSLLADGLGDTIRVSLTEDPVKEVPVARAIAASAPQAARSEPQAREHRDAIAGRPRSDAFLDDPFGHVRRTTQTVACGSLDRVGGESPVRAELEIGAPPADAEAAVWRLADSLGARREISCEGLRLDVADDERAARDPPLAEALARHGVTAPLALRMPRRSRRRRRTSRRAGSCRSRSTTTSRGCGAVARARGGGGRRAGVVARGRRRGARVGRRARLRGVASRRRSHARWCRSRRRCRCRRCGSSRRACARSAGRRRSCWCTAAKPAPATTPSCCTPRRISARCSATASATPSRCRCAAVSIARATPCALAYRILQGARQRTTWTEFISCPSCGRTLFDLEETTARIKAQTQHLKGVKIAIMGCIVNGPGEMADADFGYVGSGPGVVNLYVGHECVERHVPQAEADARLMALIRRHGRWVDPA